MDGARVGLRGAGKADGLAAGDQPLALLGDSGKVTITQIGIDQTKAGTRQFAYETQIR